MRFAFFLIVGLTICLATYVIWPSSLHLRPAHEPMAERPGKCHWRLWLRYGSLILAILIVLSTVFIRQHSVVDVVFALILSLLLYPLAGWFGRRFGKSG